MDDEWVSVAIINYNGRNVLEDTIASIYNQRYRKIREIILVDNHSTDESIQFVRKKYPKIKIISLERNLGPNAARNTAILSTSTKLLLIMDNDIVLNSDVLGKLTKVYSDNAKIGAVSAQIRYFDHKDQIQYNGCNIHYVGECAVPISSIGKEAIGVSAVSAGTVLIESNIAKKIGLFDEDFIFGWEDGDFTYRLTILGYSCRVVPSAHVYHKKNNREIRHVKLQIRNRWWFIIKNYHIRTILFLLPAIAIFQIAAFIAITMKGYSIEFLKGLLAVPQSLPSLVAKHRIISKQRILDDKDVLIGKGLTLFNTDSPIIIGLTKFLDSLFSIYWYLVKWAIK